MHPEPSEPDRVDDEVFFGAAAPRPGWWSVSVPEAIFYSARRPAPEAGFFETAAQRPLQFGLILFALGWMGILFQRGFVRQLVVGAPVFEELAKMGLALVPVAFLGGRHLFSRIPWAWLSGALFAIFEHESTYPDEDLLSYALRIAFHAGATGLSMAAYTALEPHGELRVRWTSTLPATLVHWGNNFGVVLVALLAAMVGVADQAALAWSVLMTIFAYALTVAVLLRGEAVRAGADRVLARLDRAMKDATPARDPASD